MKNAIFLILCAILVQILPSIDCDECNLSTELKTEIRMYEKVVERIYRHVVDDDGPFKSVTWNKLAEFVDDFGSRLTGSLNLENAINFLFNEFEKNKFENVHTEDVKVPHWVR